MYETFTDNAFTHFLKWSLNNFVILVCVSEKKK